MHISDNQLTKWQIYGIFVASLFDSQFVTMKCSIKYLLCFTLLIGGLIWFTLCTYLCFLRLLHGLHSEISTIIRPAMLAIFRLPPSALMLPMHEICKTAAPPLTLSWLPRIPNAMGSKLFHLSYGSKYRHAYSDVLLSINHGRTVHVQSQNHAHGSWFAVLCCDG